MAGFNKVVLVGNLTRDPELKYTPKGTAIGVIRLAVTRKYRNEAGETKEDTTFLDVEAFGRSAETIGQYMRKGSPILIEGRLRMDTWDDKQTGQKRSKLVVVAEGFQFLGGPRSGDGAAPSPQAPAASRPAPPPPAEMSGGEAETAPPDDDDVPF